MSTQMLITMTSALGRRDELVTRGLDLAEQSSR
ncbi:hypothetical protein BH11MYX3_BH11MYX3_36980 [soil metagenome]